MDSSEHLRFKVSFLFFGTYIGIRAVRILLDNIKWRRMIREKQYMTVDEVGATISSQTKTLEAYDKLVVDMKNKGEARAIVIGKLASDLEWNMETKRREEVYFIQDYQSLSTLKLAQVKSLDMIQKGQVASSTVLEKISKGVVVDLSQKDIISKVTPLAVLGTLYFDKDEGNTLKLKNFKCIEDSLKTVELFLEESDTTQYLVLTVSAIVVAYALFSLRNNISFFIKDCYRFIVNRKRGNQAEGSFSDEQLCIACYSSPRQVLTLPCKHFAMCRGCLQHYQSDKCIICKEIIRSIEFIDQQP